MWRLEFRPTPQARSRSAVALLTTDYVYRGITNSAEKPAVQPEFDLTYKTFYAGIWGSNVNFGSGPNGQNLASLEIDYWVGMTPTLGKWKFDFAAYYDTYPGAFDPEGEFDYLEIWTGVSRSFFNDKLELNFTTTGRLNISARPVTMTCSNSAMSGPLTRSGTSRQNSAAMLVTSGAI